MAERGRTDRARTMLRYLDAERSAARLYRRLAELTHDERAAALNELADIEDKHATHWIDQLRELGVNPTGDDGSLEPDDQELLRRARQLSLDSVLPDLERAERDARAMYDEDPDATPQMVRDEHDHEVVLARLRRDGRVTAPGSAGPSSVRETLNAAEPWHGTDRSGSLRAAVFGASDGLVSNTALVMGFAGSGVDSSTVLFAGVAGLLAGAFSMAAGEYVSVASQRDVFRREIALEAEELRDKPQEEQKELELLYRAKGLDRSTARETAHQIMADPDSALDTLAREELGLDPDELGSPVRVAAASFVSFAAGALVPVVPYLIASGTEALILAVAFALVALAVVGGTVGRMSNLGVLRSATRQLLVGAGAGAITYLVGSLVGLGMG